MAYTKNKDFSVVNYTVLAKINSLLQTLSTLDIESNSLDSDLNSKENSLKSDTKDLLDLIKEYCFESEASSTFIDIQKGMKYLYPFSNFSNKEAVYRMRILLLKISRDVTDSLLSSIKDNSKSDSFVIEASNPKDIINIQYIFLIYYLIYGSDFNSFNNREEDNTKDKVDNNQNLEHSRISSHKLSSNLI